MYVKRLCATFLLCLTFTAGNSIAEDKQAASAFADDLGHKALAIITEGNLSKPDKQARLEALFEQNVDIDWIGKFVLGRYWKNASEEQRQAYLANYRSFTIKHYTSNISDFTNADFEVTKVRPDGNDGDIVTMRIKRPKAEDVIAEYTIRQQEKGGLKVYDIAVEGVSMITTQRSEFNSVVSQKGIDYLIAQLKQRSLSAPGDSDQSRE